MKRDLKGALTRGFAFNGDAEGMRIVAGLSAVGLAMTDPKTRARAAMSIAASASRLAGAACVATLRVIRRKINRLES